MTMSNDKIRERRALLDAYTSIERAGLPVSERLADIMDLIWKELDDAGRDFLNSRTHETAGLIINCPSVERHDGHFRIPFVHEGKPVSLVNCVVSCRDGGYGVDVGGDTYDASGCSFLGVAEPDAPGNDCDLSDELRVGPAEAAKPCCCALSPTDRYMCSLPTEHGGRHEAWGSDVDGVLDSWGSSDEDAVTERQEAFSEICMIPVSVMFQQESALKWVCSARGGGYGPLIFYGVTKQAAYEALCVRLREIAQCGEGVS